MHYAKFKGLPRRGPNRSKRPRFPVPGWRFREARYTCFLSVSGCADLLRVSERTIRNWESGKVRIPYAAFKLMRLLRGGKVLGDEWRHFHVRLGTYRLEYSKTQQAGVTVDSTPDKPILGRSAEALAAWLDAGEIHEGAIFRRIWKGRVGPALLPGSVASIVKRRAKLARLEGDFGAHSLRSGFVTEAGKQGIPLPAVMAMTEHRSVASVIGYFQAGAAEDNPAARLLK